MTIRRCMPMVLGACLVVLICLAAADVASRAIWPDAAVAQPVRPQLAKAGGFSLLIKPDGSLWAWGDNAAGQLGINYNTLLPIPWRVGTATDWAAVACGNAHALALKSDGSLWAWGDNASGQLGLGDKTRRSVPIRVGGATDWSAIACGDLFSLALKRDGSLWAWGVNTYGQLGVGDTASRTSPTRVGSDLDWRMAAGGTFHALALKQDGSLWSWGRNDHGQLGRTGTSSQLTPARIGMDAGWSAVDCADEDSRAMKTDGSLWAWGYNSYGQLGQGDTTARDVPARVGEDSWWALVTCGDDHTVATRTDGSLWAWGDNTYGQLGQGDASPRTSPTRVGTDTDWTAVACGDDDTAALKLDGSLWTWGNNNVGQLGQADFIRRSTPAFAFNVGDTAAPVISALDSPTHAQPETWYSNSSPSFTWSASDPSGMGGYRYVLDQSAGGDAPVLYPHAETTYTCPSKSDGIWYFHVRAVDRAGNWGPTSTRQVMIDTTAPVTTQTGADAAWHLVPVTVTFRATDARSGVAATEYRVDAGSWTPGNAVTVVEAGAHTVAYRSRDNASNVEADKTCQVNIQGMQSSYTITPSVVGLNGTITPTGVVTVGRGGSQTFTIAPNANYRILDVLVDGVSNPAAVSSGTFTFSNVLAAHTISATFSASAATITATAGANGSITPPGVQTVAIGGNQTYTITPNTGYHRDTVLVDGVTDPTAVTSGTYSFTNVTANHTISATFVVDQAITVTVPNGTESWLTGSTQNLGWTVTSAVSVGQFGVWLVNQTTGTWYGAGYFDATPAQTTYSPSFVVTSVPDGIYKAVVYYRVDPTQWVWQVNGISAATATITQAAMSISVIVPIGIESWTTGSTQTLGWTVSSAVAVGQFGVWLVNETTGVWYEAGFFDAVPVQTTYSPTFTVPTLPDGNYKAVVYYRTDPTQWVWQTNAMSLGAATITPGGLAINVSVPNGTENWTVASSQTLGWTVWTTVSVGQFGVWLIDQSTGTWYEAGFFDAQPAQSTYTPTFTVPAVPAGTYKATVYYRTDPTQWVWSANALSLATANIAP